MSNYFDFTHYTHLTHFMGACLGDHTEVVLYSFEDINNSVIAIANQGVSGIALGDPLTGFAISAMKDKGKEGPPYYLNHLSLSKSNKPLKSNSLLILDNRKNPKGMLTTYTDVTFFSQVATLFQKMASMPSPGYHEQGPGTPQLSPEPNGSPHAAPQAAPQAQAQAPIQPQHPQPLFPSTMSPVDMIHLVIEEITQVQAIAPERLTTKEKVAIVERLNGEGFFLIKGAVSQVAGMIGASEATIYRYLSNLTKPTP